MGDMFRTQMKHLDATMSIDPIEEAESINSAGGRADTVSAQNRRTPSSQRHDLKFLLSLDSEPFVNKSYVAMLGREPDLLGREHYLNDLKRGRSKLAVLADLYFSIENKMAGKRNLTYTGLFFLVRLRNAPVLKYALDCLVLPWLLLDAVKRFHRLELIAVSQQQQQQLIGDRLFSEQAMSLGLLDQLLQRLDKQVAETAALTSKENIKVSSALNKAVLTLQSELTNTRAGIVRQVNEASAALKVELAASIVDVQRAILEELTLGQKVQSQLLQRLGKQVAETAALTSKENIKASSSLDKAVLTLQSELTNTRAGIVRQVNEASAALKVELPASIVDVQCALLEELTLGQKAQRQLLQGLDKQAAETAALTSKQNIKASSALNNAVLTLQSALADTRASIARQLSESSNMLEAAVPTSSEDLKRAILAELALGQELQSQLLQRVDRHAVDTATLVRMERGEVSSFVLKSTEQVAAAVGSMVGDLKKLEPQLGRIELYGLTAAQRVAIRCGADAVMIRTQVGYVLCAADDYALIAGLIERGELECGTRELIQRLLEPGDIFVDVGANIGMHTIAAAQAMRGQGRVIAFEPFLPTAQLLEKSVWMNGYSASVEIHQVAAANTSTSRSLYLGATSSHHSLFPLGANAGYGAPVVQVQTVTIDDVVPLSKPVTLIKIDVEGAELDVLNGAKRLLAASPDSGLIVEFGRSHLQRAGIKTADWLSHFKKLGMDCWEITSTNGELRNLAVENLDKIDSLNLFFANSKSPLLRKAKFLI